MVRSQNYICVPSDVGAKLPLAPKELLFQIPGGRVTSKEEIDDVRTNISAAPFLRKQRDFAFVEVLGPSEIDVFREILDCWCFTTDLALI